MTLSSLFAPATRPPALFVAMVASVVLANVCMPIALTEHISLGTVAIACSFLINELTHRLHGRAVATQVVLAGFVAALALSFWLAPWRIALASASAFLAGQLLDVAIFARLRRGQWWRAPLWSALVASSLDTLLFFTLAFVGTATPWWQFAVADWLCKIGLSFAFVAPFRYVSGTVAN